MSTATATELRERIQAALSDFARECLPVATRALFETLGYRSERDSRALQIASVADFLSWLEKGHRLESLTARDRDDLRSSFANLHFLFQLGDDEIRAALGSAQLSLFESSTVVDGSRMASYLVFAAELAGDAPRTRTVLARLVRLINKPLPMPALVLFQHGDTLTLGVINRRLHKRDATRDVLEKVTLIRDILFDDPLRAHIEILRDLSLDALHDEYHFDNFVGLHQAWESRLGSYALNERFYREIANWYFWALTRDDVTLPRSIEEIQDATERDKQRAIFFIRLLTRLIFCWFLQEKRLIPRDLFRPRVAQELLKDPSPEAGTYYRAFLQNLFFATLNQEQPNRGWRKKYRGSRDGNRGVTNLWRYQDLVTDLDRLEALLRDGIPFVNGGLFDCLDDQFAEPMIFLDGFSERRDNEVCLPNDLFFGGEREVDLSAIYDDKRRRREKVRGLIETLSHYKFTVEENTPLEEEVALDPELLGKVFENLLASYSEDTRTIARKALGAFYTPREIVNYMVDETLITYLGDQLASMHEDSPESESTAQDARLRALFTVQPGEFENPFTPAETTRLITAIGRLKILDPACGSGAFPMGVLHRLVDLLQKLDPNNEGWKRDRLAEAERYHELLRQTNASREELDQVQDRIEDIRHSFDTRFHALDFGRKLYLIERCLYGVDIQPIACQIAKLRFFISLIVDQRADPGTPNLGVRPLPNLETRIVAADSLVPIEKPGGQLEIFEPEIRPLRKQLEQVRHEYFNARTPARKRRCRQRDKELRDQIAESLRQSGWNPAVARKLAFWDPYDQNHAAPFFDPEWMFGLPVGKVRVDVAAPATVLGNFAFINELPGQLELTPSVEIESGFDIVIGNPPYVLVQSTGQTGNALEKWHSIYVAAQYKVDLYQVFIEASIRLLKPGGVVSLITPNSFLKNEHSAALRRLLLSDTQPLLFLLFYCRVFPGQSVDNVVFVLKKKLESQGSALKMIRSAPVRQIADLDAELSWRATPISRIKQPRYAFELDVDAEVALILDAIDLVSQPLGDLCGAYFGIQTFSRKQFVSRKRERESHTEVIDGANVHRWWISRPTEFVDFRPEAIKSGGDKRIYLKERVVVRQIGSYPEGSICSPGLLTLNTIYNIFEKRSSGDLKFVLAVINSSITRFYWKHRFFDNKATFPKIKKAPLLAIPVPSADQSKKSTVHICVDYLLWLNRHFVENEGSRAARDALMLGYFEQVLNGLVYELYFPDELHSHGLRMFDMVEHARLPAADTIPEPQRLDCLREVFERIYHRDHPLHDALDALRSLEIVRIIEGEE